MFRSEIFQLICGCLNTIVLVVGVVLTLMLCLEYRRNHSRILLSYIPNIWTSLGILGTFMAIGNSLANSAVVKNMDNASVGVLIEEIIPAFETSVIGIVGAIIASIIIKWHYSRSDKKENEAYVNSVGDNIPPELLLNNIHRSLERLIRVTQLPESHIKSFLDNYMLQLTEFYNRIFESNKEQVKALSDEYVNNVSNILAGTNEEINRRIDTLLLSHSQSIQEYLKSEEAKLEEVTNDIRSLLKGIPQTVDNMKNELIGCLRSTIIEKYNQLLDNNSSLIVQLLDDSRKLDTQLLKNSKELCKELYESNEIYSGELYKKITTLESELAQNAEQQYSNTLDTARVEMQKIITLLESSLNTHSISIEQMSTILLSHSQSIQEYLKTEETKLDEVTNDIRNFLTGVLQSAGGMKNELVECLRNTIIEKYNQLLDSNNTLIAQLLNDSRKIVVQLLHDSKELCKELYESNEAYASKLHERVISLESELSQNTEQQCFNTLGTARVEIQKIIAMLEGSLNAHSTSIEQVSATLSSSMGDIVSSVTNSSKDYKAIVDQLNRLLPILETQITHSEQSIAVTKQNEENLTSVIETLEEIAKKNQQLRYELMQWKRVHKKVKINDESGTKECPNCGAENPIDANFCRNCTCGFWDCETNV